MIRKGRFDEVFFVDLPQDDERVEIFRIHLDRRGIDSTRFDLDQLKQFTQGWSGAEIEQCVVSAITTAKLADRELTGHDLVTTAVKIVPLSRTMKEQINQIRAWAFERAVRYGAYSVSAVERILAVQAQPKTCWERLAEDEPARLGEWLTEDPTPPRPATEYQQLLSEETHPDDKAPEKNEPGPQDPDQPRDEPS